MDGGILIVDEDDAAATLRASLRRRGFEVETVASGEAALAALAAAPFDVVLAQGQLAAMSGVELCQAVRAVDPEVLTIVMSGDGLLESAIAAIRAGAYDYVAKPIDVDALVIALERALAHVRVGRELRRLRVVFEATRPLTTIVGDSPSIKKVLDLIHKVADSDVIVLIVGESGTGKELVARALHDASARREHPFVAVNCAAVSPGLLESELFGHVKGAFTDARRARPGLFVQAGRGTILLDEIGDMSPDMQVKLLRVLQDRRVRPVGAEDEVGFEARVLASTNRDLETDVADKRFREDLYYRINVVQIATPPLRVRTGDLLPLAHTFIERIGARVGKSVHGIAPDAARLLLDYDWPGNVRELENTLERAIALTTVSELSVEDLPDKIRHHRRSVLATATGRYEELISLAEVERRYVQQVLAAVGGNKTMAARILEIDRRSVYRILEEGSSPPLLARARAERRD